MFFLRNSIKYLVYLTSLLLFITNHSLSQPIKDLPFKNIVVHEVPNRQLLVKNVRRFRLEKELKFNKFDHQINLINFWSSLVRTLLRRPAAIDKLVDVVAKT